MAHRIMERDIQTGIEMAWHGLTNVVEAITIVTSDALRENSGINYGMEIVPLFYEKDGEKYETGGKQIIALDDNLPIGLPIGAGYTMISNGQILDLVHESLAGTKHKIVSVGTVEDRAIGFLSVEIDKEFKAAGRITESVLNFLWGHGGKMPLIAKTGFTVVVCKNTFNAAMSERGDFRLSVKHTKNAAQRIDNMSKVIDTYLGVRAEFKQAMDTLADISCTENKAEELFAGIIIPQNAEVMSTRSRNNVERLTQLFRGGAGNNGDDMADCFNALTDFYTHESSGGENKWKQFVSSEFGAGQRAKENALEILLDGNKRKETAKRGAAYLVS